MDEWIDMKWIDDGCMDRQTEWQTVYYFIDR